MSRMARPAVFLSAGAIALLLVGCAAQAQPSPSRGVAIATASAAPTPIASPAPTPIASPAPAITASATATMPPPGPTPMWTLTTGDLPPGFLYQVAQLDPVVDGHGGAPPLALPASVKVEYAVSGTCRFSISIYPEGAGLTPTASFSMTLTSGSVSGTWPVKLRAGSYEVVPADAPGCVFQVTVLAG
jgi:hypothetical protein